MALIGKSDLEYQYSWTVIKGDDPKVSGEPDSAKLSRHEGYEVLYLINKLSELWNFKQKSSALKLEKMIKKHLPPDIQSQEGVKDWLYSNWNNY